MYTVKEVALKMNISEHTLRFWAKSGLFPFVERNENNVRMFSEDDLNWVKIVKCLRSIGTETKEVKRYVDLCIIGDSTIPERFEIIEKTKAKALENLEELNKQIDILNFKESYYKNLIKNNSKDVWNPVNNPAKKEEKIAVNK